MTLCLVGKLTINGHFNRYVSHYQRVDPLLPLVQVDQPGLSSSVRLAYKISMRMELQASPQLEGSTSEKVKLMGPRITAWNLLG